MFNPRPLEEFVSLVTATQASGKKEIRLSLESARRISDHLNYLLLALESARSHIVELEKLNKESVISDVEFQGGKF